MEGWLDFTQGQGHRGTRQLHAGQVSVEGAGAVTPDFLGERTEEQPS